MTRLNRIASRNAGTIAVAVVLLMAAVAPLKSAGADNDDWRHHRQWYGDRYGGGYGGFYLYSNPGYYYLPPPPVYYAPPPYYAPAPYYAPPPVYYGPPSVGFSVILPLRR